MLIIEIVIQKNLIVTQRIAYLLHNSSGLHHESKYTYVGLSLLPKGLCNSIYEEQ